MGQRSSFPSGTPILFEKLPAATPRVWKSLLSMNIGLAVVNVVVIVIAGLIGFWRSKTGNIEVPTSVWAEDYQEAAES